MARHFAVTRANLDPAVLVIGGQRHGGMRGDANRAGDLLAPLGIGEKMLAKALARHGGKQFISSGVRVSMLAKSDTVVAATVVVAWSGQNSRFARVTR